MIFFKQFQIRSGLAVKSIGIGLGYDLTQILVALHILAQQHQMVAFVVDAVNPVGHPPGGHIDLAADDGLDACGLGGFIKIDTAVHDTMVGNRNRRLSQFLDPVHDAVDSAGTVQEAVFSMYM